MEQLSQYVCVCVRARVCVMCTGVCVSVIHSIVSDALWPQEYMNFVYIGYCYILSVWNGAWHITDMQ